MDDNLPRLPDHAGATSHPAPVLPLPLQDGSNHVTSPGLPPPSPTPQWTTPATGQPPLAPVAPQWAAPALGLPQAAAATPSWIAPAVGPEIAWSPRPTAANSLPATASSTLHPPIGVSDPLTSPPHHPQPTSQHQPTHTVSAPMPPGPPSMWSPGAESDWAQTNVPEQVVPRPVTKPSRRPFVLIASMAAVVAIAVGGFFVLLSRNDDQLVDDSASVVSDPESEVESEVSFAAASASAASAASLTVDMTLESPEGPIAAAMVVDRASERISMDVDLSRLEVEDADFFAAMPDAYRMIVDQSTSTAYIESSAFGELVPQAEQTAWFELSMNDNSEFESFDSTFPNPFDINAAFVDAESVDLGVELIDGEELTHFNVPAITPVGDEVGVAEIEYDVWVSKDNEIRRIAYDYLEDDESLPLLMVVKYSDEAVDISLPDPSDVTSLDDLFEMEFDEAEFGPTDTTWIDEDGSTSVELTEPTSTTLAPITTELTLDTVPPTAPVEIAPVTTIAAPPSTVLAE
jgi:hypothetical protein